MKKSLMLSAIAGMAIGSAIVFPQVVSAYKGDPKVTGPNYSVERHQAMTKAFENNDYNAWKTLMNGKGRVSQVVNEANFEKFAKAHRLAEQGKYDEANKIRAELGLGMGAGSGKGTGCGRTNR